MISLKSFIPVLAAMFGTTADILYERQRALVRIGLLKPLAGRGPGSGVQLSISSVAVLMIAYAAADTLSDVESRIRDVCLAQPTNSDLGTKCPLTGGSTFLEAVERLLALPEIVRSVLSLEIDLNGPGILLIWREGRKERFSLFGFGKEQTIMGSSIKGIMKKAHISSLLMITLSDTLLSLSISGALSPKKLADFPTIGLPTIKNAKTKNREAKPAPLKRPR